MKELLKSIIKAIFIILPILIIMLIIYIMNTYRYVVPINSENINAIQKLLDNNNLKIKLNDTVKEIAEVTSSGLAYSKFEIVYNDGNIETFEIEIWEDKGLLDYINNNSNKNNIISLWGIVLIFSVINSIHLICDDKSSQKIYYE